MPVREIIFGIAYWIVPVVLGYLLTRFRPQMAWWKCGLLAGLPFALLMLGFAAWIAMTSDITTCDNPPCHNMAPLFFWVSLLGSVFTLGLGFALGLIGRSFAPRAPAPKGE